MKFDPSIKPVISQSVDTSNAQKSTDFGVAGLYVDEPYTNGMLNIMSYIYI
jgi:hypothetical protein